MPINSGLKAKKRKTLYRRRIPIFSSSSKETVDTDILITSRNGDRKVVWPIRITSGPSTRTSKRNQSSQLIWTLTKVKLKEKTRLLLVFLVRSI